jgi:hypothetical protein
MVDFDLLEKAKRAREQAAAAAAKAVEMANQASLSAGELKDSVASTAQGMKESLASAASELREASIAKVKETLADFNSAVPVLRTMGYALSDVSITLGMPPSLQATFQISHEADEETTARTLDQNADRPLTVFLIRTLSQARKLQKSIEVAGMKPRGIAVEIGLSPSVAIKFA